MKKITIDGTPLTMFSVGKAMTIMSLIFLVILGTPFLYIAFTRDPMYSLRVFWVGVIFVPLGVIGGGLMFYDWKRKK